MVTRHIVGGMVAACVAAFSAVSTANADPLEAQFDQLVEALEGKRVGLLTNPTAVDSQFQLIADRLHAHPDVDLAAFFAPEHGIRGDLQAGAPEDDLIDPVTGLPVYSLYGPRRSPTPEQIEDLDVVVFDIQDVGARFYTYQWTMTNVMEACAEHGKSFVVFDRPNPIGIDKMQGAPNTFDVGLIGRKWPDAPFGIPTRHGLTVGELAILVNEEWMDPQVDLTVIEVPGLTRDMTFEETGYPWVLPSPNMPTLETAFVYTGMCLFEGVNISEGRGTTRPFELVGAPWIEGHELAEHLNAKGLPGVRFRPAWFQPTFSTHAGDRCGGIQVHVTDRDAFEPVRTGIHVLKAITELYPDDVNVRNGVSRLMGVENLHTRIWDEDPDDIVAEWQGNLQAFKDLVEPHLLYDDGAGNGWNIE